GVALTGDGGNNLLAAFYIQTDAKDLNVMYHNAKVATNNLKLGTFGAFDNEWLRCTGNSGHYHLFFFLSSHLMIFFPEGCRGDIPQTRVTTLTIVENLNVFPYY
ncbi:hypothetical protein GRW41_25395, partial [Escherichia coli]|nr:hypothetical protein [Escherichia coli]